MSMEIALVQYDITWQDKPTNHARIEAMLDEASVAPGAFILLPELGDTGFTMDLDAATEVDSIEWAVSLARRRDWTIQVGHAERHLEQDDR